MNTLYLLPDIWYFIFDACLTLLRGMTEWQILGLFTIRFKELSAAAHHLSVHFVRKRFVLEYLRFHSSNHGSFQINWSLISSTRCSWAIELSFSLNIFEIQVVYCVFHQYLCFYHYIYLSLLTLSPMWGLLQDYNDLQGWSLFITKFHSSIFKTG